MSTDLPRLHLDGPGIDDEFDPDPLWGDSWTRAEIRTRPSPQDQARMAQLSLQPEDTLMRGIINRACVLGAAWGATPYTILHEIAANIEDGPIPEQEPLRRALEARRARMGTERDARMGPRPTWGSVRGGDVDDWPES